MQFESHVSEVKRICRNNPVCFYTGISLIPNVPFQDKKQSFGNSKEHIINQKSSIYRGLTKFQHALNVVPCDSGVNNGISLFHVKAKLYFKELFIKSPLNLGIIPEVNAKGRVEFHKEFQSVTMKNIKKTRDKFDLYNISSTAKFWNKEEIRVMDEGVKEEALLLAYAYWDSQMERLPNAKSY